MLNYAGMALLVLLAGGAASAQEAVTDANIVTGLDISESIDPETMKLELDAMAKAIRDPRVLQAITAGRHRRVGFAVFAWHHSDFPTVVAWTIIESRDDALAVARQIEARKLVDVEREARRSTNFYGGRLTDLSRAIDHAAEMLANARFAAERTIINMVGSGDDNVGEEAHFARDRFVGGGGTINGLVLGADRVSSDYYRREVIGGRGAFIVTTGAAQDVAEAFVRKFVGDIVAGTPPRTDLAAAAP